MTWPTLVLCDPSHDSKSRHPFFTRRGPRKDPTGRILDVNHPFPHPHTVETLIRTGLDGQMSATVEKQFPINQYVYHAALALCLAAAATAGCRSAESQMPQKAAIMKSDVEQLLQMTLDLEKLDGW
jgi:hypothetical protein